MSRSRRVCSSFTFGQNWLHIFGSFQRQYQYLLAMLIKPFAYAYTYSKRIKSVIVHRFFLFGHTFFAIVHCAVLYLMSIALFSTL